MKNNIFFIIAGIGLSIFIIVYLSYNLSGKETGDATGNAPVVRALPENVPDNAFGIGSYGSLDASIRLFSTQYISDGNFCGYFSFMNSYNVSNQYLIMALLDYQVTPFNLNDETQSIQLIDVTPRKASFYPFNFTGIPAGYHDLTILSFQNPYNDYANVSFYDASNNLTTLEVWNRYPDVCAKRFNIINNNSARPLFELNDAEINSSLTNYDGLWITKEPFANTLLTCENFTGNDTIHYCINVMNNRTANLSFAIVQMSDYKQIPFHTNNQDNVYYGNLKKGDALSIPISLYATFDKGIHKLIVIMVTDPYKNIETSPGELNPDTMGTVDIISAGINVI